MSGDRRASKMIVRIAKSRPNCCSPLGLLRLMSPWCIQRLSVWLSISVSKRSRLSSNQPEFILTPSWRRINTFCKLPFLKDAIVDKIKLNAFFPKEVGHDQGDLLWVRKHKSPLKMAFCLYFAYQRYGYSFHNLRYKVYTKRYLILCCPPHPTHTIKPP